MSRLDSDIEQWRTAIGKAITCFGEIELVTYKCLAHIPRDQITETASRLRFGQRVKLIIEILEGRNPITNHVRLFVGMLRRAEQLASIRNVIAHNPVMLNMFVDKVSGDVALQHCISVAQRKERTIDLAAAEEYAAEVENLAAEMWNQIGIIAEGDQLNR